MCGSPVIFAWQVLQAGVGCPACGSWQPAQTLVARGRGLLLGNVARAARHRRRDRVHHRRAVARRAVGVTWVRGDERGLAGVAVPAQRLLVESPEGVRLVARLAGDASRMCRRVRRQPPSRGSSCTGAATTAASSPWGTWQVTHAPALPCVTWTSWWHRTHAVAAAPGACGRVAVHAHAVSRHLALGQRGLGAMATDACVGTDGEVVGRVASGARVVAGRMRLRRLRVARRACRLRRGRGLVGPMAVEASRRGRMLCVLRRSLVVAARAVCRRRSTASRAAGGRSCSRPWRAARWRADAPSGRAWQSMHVGAERPSPNTWQVRQSVELGLTAVMGDARLPGVAGPADCRTRVLEPVALEVVAVVALRPSAADVKRVPGGVAVLGPRRGNEIGRHALRSARPEPDERHNPQHDDHDQYGEAAEHPSCGRESSTDPVTEAARQIVVLVLACWRSRVRAGCRPARRRDGSRRRAARPRRRGSRRTTSDRCAPARRALRSPSRAGAGCSSSSPATFSRVWQSMHELSVWQVVQRPGSARASSAWRATKPAR